MELFLLIYLFKSVKLQSGEYSGFDEWKSLPDADGKGPRFWNDDLGIFICPKFYTHEFRNMRVFFNYWQNCPLNKTWSSEI